MKMKIEFTKGLKIGLGVFGGLAALAFGLYLELSGSTKLKLGTTAEPQKLSTDSGGIEPYDENGRLDINLATAEELVAVNGIGEVLAEKIIKYRDEYGAFMCIEELIKVSGIGQKNIERMRDEICVRGTWN